MPTDAAQPAITPESAKASWRARCKWLGIGAFLFFLIKGLAWLIVPAVLIWWGAT